MSDQTNSAAERSAHVLRGEVPTEAAPLHPVVEWKNERGQTLGQARGVVELRAALAASEQKCRLEYARGVRDAAKAAHAGWLDGCPYAEISGAILALLPAEKATTAPQCPMRALNCGRYEIETEPPMNPPLTACSNYDCPNAIRAYGASDDR